MFIVTLMVWNPVTKESIIKKNPDILISTEAKTRSDYMDIIKKEVDSIKLMLSRIHVLKL